MKDTGKKQYVYDITLQEQKKKPSALVNSQMGDLTLGGTASNNRIPQNAKKSTEKYSDNEDDLDIRRSIDIDRYYLEERMEDLAYYIEKKYGYNTYHEKSRISLNDTLKMVYRSTKYPKAFYTNSVGALRVYDKYRGISDILHGASNKQIFLGFGHSKVGYWDSPMRLEKETFAQFGRILYEQDSEVIRMVEEMFPDAYKETIERLEGIIK